MSPWYKNPLVLLPALIALFAFGLFVFTRTAPSPAPTTQTAAVQNAGSSAQCKDGTYSLNVGEKTCADHGGVDSWY